MKPFTGALLAAAGWRMTRSLLVPVLLASALVGGGGCRKSHVPGTVSTDAVLDAFKGAGFDVSGMKKAEADTWGADNCVAGVASSLDLVVCEFATEQALVKSEADAQRDWNVVNVETGVVQHNGRTMLLIVDRKNGDRSGRAIAKMLAAFQHAS
jgi:hypothetical protein